MDYIQCTKCGKTLDHGKHKCPIADDAVLGDEPPMTDIGLCELELIACYDGGVYWFLDYRFSDNSGGAFLNSQIYKDDKAAIFALISGTIKWSECHTEKELGGFSSNILSVIRRDRDYV